MPFVWPSRVRFVDTDASGRIHFTAMLRHFEAAEIEFLPSLGLLYKDAAASAVNFPRVQVECTYVAMVKYDDPLEIAVWVERVGNASYKLAFEASVEERLVARGFVTAVCVDVNTGRSRALPQAPARAATILRQTQLRGPGRPSGRRRRQPGTRLPSGGGRNAGRKSGSGAPAGAPKQEAEGRPSPHPPK